MGHKADEVVQVMQIQAKDNHLGSWSCNTAVDISLGSVRWGQRHTPKTRVVWWDEHYENTRETVPLLWEREGRAAVVPACSLALLQTP